jgi:hypothetical protein
MRRFAVGSVPLLLLALAGCGSSQFAPVSGTVTLDGKPIPNASVNFQPADSKDSALASSGKTDANGRYKLRVVMNNASGAVRGRHRVSISTLQEEDPTKDLPPGKQRPKDPIPARYNTRTELTFDVPAGGTSSADFALTSGPPAKPAR